jgi:hypothetical protein
MRTTLTIDDDLAGILQKMAAQPGHSFKQVVNDMLRSGLAANGEAAPHRLHVTVVGKPLRLRPGYDPDKLNQLVDELESEELASKQSES